MRVVLAAMVVVALLTLGACGGSTAEADQFAGTWQPVDSGSSGQQLVIAQAQDGYQAFFVGGPVTVGPLLLERDGDTLVFPAQNGVERQTFTLDSGDGTLTVVDGSKPGIAFELASRSTSHPAVESPQSSPDEEF